MNNKQLKALLASYGRSVLGAGIALYLSGVTDPLKLASALIAALVPVAIRYLNPNDTAFGRVPTASEVDKAVKSAKVDADGVKAIEDLLAKAAKEVAPKKAPAKKTTPKK